MIVWSPAFWPTPSFLHRVLCRCPLSANIHNLRHPTLKMWKLNQWSLLHIFVQGFVQETGRFISGTYLSLFWSLLVSCGWGPLSIVIRVWAEHSTWRALFYQVRKVRIAFLAGRIWVCSAHINTAFFCFLFLWQLMFSMRLTIVKKVEQDFEYANVRGWFVVVSPFWSMFFLPPSLFLWSIDLPVFPCFDMLCAYSQSRKSVCFARLQLNRSNQEPNFHIWENSMSGMHHLIRLLHMMKHHVTNIQSWKFSVPPLISNHLR